MRDPEAGGPNFLELRYGFGLDFGGIEFLPSSGPSKLTDAAAKFGGAIGKRGNAGRRSDWFAVDEHKVAADTELLVV
jgi:hypothetical protein